MQQYFRKHSYNKYGGFIIYTARRIYVVSVQSERIIETSHLTNRLPQFRRGYIRLKYLYLLRNDAVTTVK